MKKVNTSLLMSQVQLLLAEKRTSLATLRTGITVFVLPLSVLTILVSTSSYYNVFEVPHFLIPLIGICIFLVSLGLYLIYRAIKNIREFDDKINRIKKQSKVIESLIPK
jgi:uncharacterized membrane protein YidH (DUF202 family)